MAVDKLFLVVLVFALFRGTVAVMVVVGGVPRRHRAPNSILGLVVTAAPETLTARGGGSADKHRSRVDRGGWHE